MVKCGLVFKHFNTWKDEVYEVNARASNPVSFFLMFALAIMLGASQTIASFDVTKAFLYI